MNKEKVIRLLEDALTELRQKEEIRRKPKPSNCRFLIRSQTSKAYLVDFIEPRPIDAVWLPVALVQNDEQQEDGSVTATLPVWIMKEKLLID